MGDTYRMLKRAGINREKICVRDSRKVLVLNQSDGCIDNEDRVSTFLHLYSQTKTIPPDNATPSRP